ncbi:hypothetical protein Pfo_000856 [Paulownia fortunei]|nr:hypothetical protein Pfo_000856 [Paulownia fortunei]
MECKRLQSRRSAAIIAGNDDLLMEIILLLPAKPLIRFQSVSKHWHSLISSQSFCHHHTRLQRHRPKPPPSFILRTIPPRFFYFNPTSKVFVPFSFNPPYTRILQSSHGLLLLECRNSPYGRKDYCVYNPTTGQARKLLIDCGGKNKKKTIISGICLAFDPSRSPHYKVVCLMNTLEFLSNFRVEVYDSESHTWKGIGKPLTLSINMKFRNGIYWNNGIYWIRPSSRSFYLDIEKGILGSPPEIRTPSRKHGEINKNYVMESNGHVHGVAMYLRPEVKSLLVFELLDDNSGWFEKYRADLSPISAALPEMNGRVGVLGIVRGEREEESSVLLHVPGKVICYRFCDGSFEVVLDLKTDEIYAEDQLQFHRHDAYQFVESLAPV